MRFAYILTRSLLLFTLSLCLFLSCATLQPAMKPSAEYQSLSGTIPIPPPTREQREVFHRDVKSGQVTLRKGEGKVFSGYVTDNRAFLEQVITPLLAPHVQELSTQHPAEMINTLTLFGFEIYRVYFGEPSHTWEFYRWGGDLFDLDDPQERGYRHDDKYGLDCSGFISLPYDLAVHFGLLDAKDAAAVFSSRGFEQHCRKLGSADRGGRGGTSNRYRVDSIDVSKLGRVLFSVKKGQPPNREDLEKLQAGDLVSGPGHVGIIVEARGELYYLESGRDVIPPKGTFLVPAAVAIETFADHYSNLTVRRSLPDYGRIGKQ